MAYTVKIEKRRGFQPPWYTVAVYRCECGRTTTIRRSWRGPTPRGATLCGCGAQLAIH